MDCEVAPVQQKDREEEAMLLISQNREKVIMFGISFNTLEYLEEIDRKSNEKKVQHKICISDGCLEEIAEYKSKERCIAVLIDICIAYKEKNMVYELPAE